MVRSRRLELPRENFSQRPQRCASTNSATTAVPTKILKFFDQQPNYHPLLSKHL